ncbi:MAG: dihydropteroate synthase [Armatimonadota bacterium]|nr:dihydropteroate synthase [Armatimonadota bacterium]MCX7776830.1 dihydropteroate synthase [Armatimonadota bacterium]MDW8024625.1 dihydropteroate synthase [Armatimonadota bacterium]
MVQWLKVGGYKLPIGKRTLIMGILNTTPDSFSGDGIYNNVQAAVDRAMRMVEEGADIIDVGGESTRPGSMPVSVDEELRRVIPVIERLVGKIGVPISIDTYKPKVAKLAIEAGACIVNDIYGLRNEGLNEGMLQVIADYKPAVIIMHMQGTPQTMQINPSYNDCVTEIKSFLATQAKKAVEVGLEREQIIIDPGIGFGKLLEHNLEILRRLREFKELGLPLLVGTSRKSFIGQVLNLPVEKRIWGTAASVVIAVANGADIVRVHDVAEMAQVVRLTDAVLRS